MARIVTFGEIMMRLNPEGYLRFVQADRFEASYAGAEANAAASLACYGHDAAFVTKLPEHEIGQCAVNELRRYGVDTSCILRGGSRIGIYFVEKGASQRPSKVIYDRAGSSFATAGWEEFDWETILQGAQWFHFTGITPALGEGPVRACLEACRTAKRKGIPVSCDLNYRKKLWEREEAGKTMGALMPYVDVCVSNEEDVADVFGFNAGDTDVSVGKLDKTAYAEVAGRLSARFGCVQVAFTLRESLSASDNIWSGMLYDAGERRAYFSKEYHIHIVDRVGGGDSFGAGLIHALLGGYGPQRAIDFAAAASCLKHSVERDFNLASEAEIAALAAGDASGRVRR